MQSQEVGITEMCLFKTFTLYKLAVLFFFFFFFFFKLNSTIRLSWHYSFTPFFAFFVIVLFLCGASSCIRSSRCKCIVPLGVTERHSGKVALLFTLPPKYFCKEYLATRKLTTVTDSTLSYRVALLITPPHFNIYHFVDHSLDIAITFNPKVHLQFI